MAVATYGTDLQTVNLAETNTNWSEMTGRTSGGADTQEDRAYIQGSYAVSQSTGVATGRTVGLQYDYLSNISWTSGWVFLVWQYWQAPKAIGTWADGGMRFAVGSSAGNVNLWNAQGNDFGRNPYGGWANVAVDPQYTPDEVIGTPVAGDYRIFCSAPYLLAAVSKGNPHCVDAIRYGRGQLKVEYGEAANYGTFLGMATANDDGSARWGLFSYQFGSYIWKGLMTLGTSTNAVDFRDANRNIVIDDCPRTYADFNKIEIVNANSRVDLTAISFLALGTTARGNWITTNDADINIDGCTFTDMGTFGFLPVSTILNSVFRRCNLVTTGGATFTGCTIDSTNDATRAVTASSPANAALITGSKFISSGTKHGLEITGTAANMTLTNDTWTGYAASDGSTGNEAVYVNIATGTMDLVISGGTTPSVRTAGATVTVISGAVSATVKVTDTSVPPNNTQNARVLVQATSGGPFPANASVSITSSASTATVTHTAHAMATNDKVLIKGANEIEYNGVFTITKIDANSYSYTVSGTPATPATGSPTSTFVVLSGLTDVNGEITMSRVFSSNQPVSGRARKSSTVPFLKTANFTGTVSSSAGLSVTLQMIADE